MARIDEDIVAKAAFYAGLAQTLAPEELPDDIRSNGNSLLKDVVSSVSSDPQVDRGLVKKVMRLENGKLEFSTKSKLIPVNVIYRNKRLTTVGLEDFLTVYSNSPDVVCIYHSVRDAEERLPIGNNISTENGYQLVTDEDEEIVDNDIFIRDTDEDIIVVETNLPSNEEVTVICSRSIALDNSFGYLRVDCRKEVRAYIVDYTAFLLASLYSMASKDDCANRMMLSLNHCKKVEIPHITEPDVVLGMQRMRGLSPIRNTSNPTRGY